MVCETSLDKNEEQQRLMQRKHARVLKLREEYIKQITNPYRHGTGIGGPIFDSGIQRFMSMRTSQYDFFKANKKTAGYGSLALLIPIVLFGWAAESNRRKQENLYRTGQVAYKDRRFKFI